MLSNLLSLLNLVLHSINNFWQQQNDNIVIMTQENENDAPAIDTSPQKGNSAKDGKRGFFLRDFFQILSQDRIEQSHLSIMMGKIQPVLLVLVQQPRLCWRGRP
jgi:hypothetical protein